MDGRASGHTHKTANPIPARDIQPHKRQVNDSRSRLGLSKKTYRFGVHPAVIRQVGDLVAPTIVATREAVPGNHSSGIIIERSKGYPHQIEVGGLAIMCIKRHAHVQELRG
jgi:hypothetical protein